jgi:hypothetical protein
MDPRVRRLRALRERVMRALANDPKNEELLELRKRVGERLVEAEAGGVNNLHTIAGQIVRYPEVP